MDKVLSISDFQKNSELFQNTEDFYLQLDSVKLKNVKNKYNDTKQLFLMEVNEEQKEVLRYFIKVKKDNKLFIQEDFVTGEEEDDYEQGLYNVIIIIKVNPYQKNNFYTRLVRTKFLEKCEDNPRHLVSFN